MILDKLNNEQRVAVKQEGNVLLTACPGSGKTRVIIHKLAYELTQLDQSSKKRIVALTFTVRASEEIFRRLNAMGINSGKIWSGTLHSFCFEWIIKPYSCYLPELKNGYSIADETFCSDLINSLKEKHGLQQIDPVNLRFNRDGSFIEPKSVQRKLLKEYHEILKSKKLIDFELLLFYSYRILITYPKIQQTLSNLFKLICVDEYQDTQDLLYAIISVIIKAGNGNTSLFLVGDTDQAIYASLGGVAKSMAEIKAEIDGMPINPLTLTGNYRSSQRIIDFYTHFQTQTIKIEAVGSNSETVGLITLNNTIHHAKIVDEIARLIQMSLDSGIPEDEICVLVPQWWLITSVSKKLRATLPDVHFDASGLAPMSRNRENIWYKLSRLFLTEPNPKIYSSRYRWAAELIDNFRVQTNTEFNEEFRIERNLLKLINSIKSSEPEGIDYLNDCFDQFLEAVEIDVTKYPQLVENRKLFFDSIESRLNDPDFKVPSDIQSFKSFYREMTGVIINTCVGVKGEEFETVIAYGLLNGYIPHWNEIFSGNATDASKKLMYVICSRAKTNLHLISETGRTTRRGDALTITPELASKVFRYDEI
ncbi:UvrD-helicase domain-containing protein [Daejeonella sp.]|uniref:UvrD-helicase domain-containing protein n=1 Tax=Daejeonella sp. TaxID=2805397 RepID=UPI00272FBACA|nr:ATP-dependent helicase [Daejeonella sp.]MDP2414813.1 ATP-dependent helicase [Daejeonella sp.]